MPEGEDAKAGIGEWGRGKQTRCTFGCILAASRYHKQKTWPTSWISQGCNLLPVKGAMFGSLHSPCCPGWRWCAAALAQLGMHQLCLGLSFRGSAFFLNARGLPTPRLSLAMPTRDHFEATIAEANFRQIKQMGQDGKMINHWAAWLVSSAAMFCRLMLLLLRVDRHVDFTFTCRLAAPRPVLSRTLRPGEGKDGKETEIEIPLSSSPARAC